MIKSNFSMVSFGRSGKVDSGVYTIVSKCKQKNVRFGRIFVFLYGNFIYDACEQVFMGASAIDAEKEWSIHSKFNR